MNKYEQFLIYLLDAVEMKKWDPCNVMLRISACKGYANYNAMQIQNPVSAYVFSNQLLPIGLQSSIAMRTLLLEISL